MKDDIEDVQFGLWDLTRCHWQASHKRKSPRTPGFQSKLVFIWSLIFLGYSYTWAGPRLLETSQVIMGSLEKPQTRESHRFWLLAYGALARSLRSKPSKRAINPLSSKPRNVSEQLDYYYYKANFWRRRKNKWTKRCRYERQRSHSKGRAYKHDKSTSGWGIGNYRHEKVGDASDAMIKPINSLEVTQRTLWQLPKL